MDKFEDRQFTASYNRLMLLTFAVVLLIAFALIGIQVSSQSRHDEAQLLEQFRTRSIAIDNLIVSVGEHLDLMQGHAEAHFLDPGHGRSRLQTALAPTGPGQYALDEVPPPQVRDGVGNLTGDGDLADLPPATRDELEMAFGLNSLFAGVRRNIPNAAWVYYTSQQRFINIQPWVPSATARFGTALYDKPFYQLGLPAGNPGRAIRWTPLYVDEYGKGMMVTATKPVYRGAEFLGTVSIDLTLDELTAYVRGFADGKGELMIVNEGGELIAHPTATSSRDTRVQRLADVLPAPLRTAAGTLLGGAPLQPARQAGHVHLWYAMKHAPWKVLYVAQEPTLLARTLDRAGVDFLVLLAALTAMLATMRTVTFREFIRPAEKLVRHIYDESRGEAGAPPPVPRPWLPWFGEVSRAFGQNRALLEEVRVKNQQLTDLNISLARYTPRFILLVSTDPGSGGTTIGQLFADALARKDPAKSTVYLEFPDPGRLARELGVPDGPQTWRHPDGYDIWTSYDLGQIPEDGVSSLLMARLLHKYDNVVIHARVQPPAAAFIDRHLEPMVRHAKAVFLLLPAGASAVADGRQLARQLRKAVRQDRASVFLLANHVRPGAPAVAEADFEIPWMPGRAGQPQDRCACSPEAAAVIGRLVDRVERVHQISAYIPTTTAVDRPVDTSEVMQRTLTYFTTRFGGATSTQAQGAWNSDSAGVVSERVYLVVSYTTQEDLSQHVDDVIDFMRQIKTELAQEAMAIEIDRKLILV